MLYLVLDKDIAEGKILEIAKKAAQTDIDIVQFRDKRSCDRDFFDLANRLKKIFYKRQIFIINDRVDIAKVLNSDGLHLGQDDLAVSEARKILGQTKFIGLSCHNFVQVKEAEKTTADYISIGPIFDTPLKPNYKVAGLGLLRRANAYVDKPCFAIGGINLKNLNRIVSSGVKKVAVCRLICKAGDVKLRINTIKERLSF